MMVHIKPRVSFGLLSTISSARMLTNLICGTDRNWNKYTLFSIEETQTIWMYIYITNIWKQWNEIVLWFGSLKTRRESFAIRRRHWTTARAIIFRFYWRLTKKAFSLQTQICKKQKKYIRDHYLILFIYIFIYIFLQLSRVNANMELKDRKGEKSRYGKKKEDSSDLIKFFCSSTFFF